ncbi:B3 domain-containing protein At2g31720-like [Bidens hawaiensis]|uniref:B3 domain-containing protein At2g31720-like n=1 Tax=Bidens hawaiensis TaxID=980011 RepID=UPI00404919DB
MKLDSGMLMNEDITVQLKRFITGEMYGLDMKLVIQKTLFESDLNTTQNRLNMPIKQLLTRPHEFLTAEEIHVVNESKEGIEVRVVGPAMQMYKRPLRLKMWHMKRNDNYVLKTNWNNFVADNKVLEKHKKIQVWSFRKHRQLCFAIVPVERPDAANKFCYSC